MHGPVFRFHPILQIHGILKKKKIPQTLDKETRKL